MRPATSLTPALGSLKSDHCRKLRPVDRIKPFVLGTDRHRACQRRDDFAPSRQTRLIRDSRQRRFAKSPCPPPRPLHACRKGPGCREVVDRWRFLFKHLISPLRQDLSPQPRARGRGFAGVGDAPCPSTIGPNADRHRQIVSERAVADGAAARSVQKGVEPRRHGIHAFAAVALLVDVSESSERLSDTIGDGLGEHGVVRHQHRMCPHLAAHAFELADINAAGAIGLPNDT